ncbi:MAG TPA: hypothetical protein VEZ41_05095 [Allosphingosinicella sp.]|nr:hypothetical protein [Allosphingosinicella sp.]
MGVIDTNIREKAAGLDLAARGYQVLFRPNESNRCPGCGRAQWFVGRQTAECVFCATALPLAEARWGESGGVGSRFRPATEVDADERRKQARRPGNGRTVRLLVDGSPLALAAHNISSGGAMVDAPAGLVSAKSIEVIAPSGEIVGASLRWSTGEVAGLQFDQPLAIHLARPDSTP